MQIVLGNSRDFLERYVASVRGTQAPDLYVCLACERSVFSVGGMPEFMVTDDKNFAVMNGQIVSCWSFIDELTGTGYLYRHLEARDSDGEWRVAEPHATYVELLARLRTMLGDKFETRQPHEIEEMLPEVRYGVTGDAYPAELAYNIFGEHLDPLSVFYFEKPGHEIPPGGGQGDGGLTDGA